MQVILGPQERSALHRRVLLVVLLSWLFSQGGLGWAQELTPRTYTNVPSGVNFFLVGYGFTAGDRLLDPIIPIEDLDARSNFFLARYTRSLAVGGRSAKIKAALPFAFADWSGTFEGAARERRVDGFGDLALAFEWNLFGAPAQTRDDFQGSRERRTVGLGLAAVLPVGNYDSDKFLNLGSNRLVLKPQIGVSQPLGKWAVEGVLSVVLFGDNSDFFGGSELKQRAFLELQGHIVYTVRPGFWLSTGLGFGEGGELKVDGEVRSSDIENWRFGASVAYPVTSSSGLILSLFSTVRARFGDRLDGGLVAYQFSWGGK